MNILYPNRREAKALYKTSAEVDPKKVDRIIDDTLSKIKDNVEHGELKFDFPMRSDNDVTAYIAPKSLRERFRNWRNSDDYDPDKGLEFKVNLNEVMLLRDHLSDLGYTIRYFEINNFGTKLSFTVEWK